MSIAKNVHITQKYTRTRLLSSTKYLFDPLALGASEGQVIPALGTLGTGEDAAISASRYAGDSRGLCLSFQLLMPWGLATREDLCHY